MRAYRHHYEESVLVTGSPEQVFAYADDHRKLSSHMGEASWRMASSSMTTKLDELDGRAVGSHIRMSGRVLGAQLYLDEVVIQREPNRSKTWETLGPVRLLVVSDYRMGFLVAPVESSTRLTVSIDYNLPETATGRALGTLFGKLYAQWCVRQMIQSVRNGFEAVPAPEPLQRKGE